MHYFPLSPAFFSILVGLLVVAILLIHFGILSYAYVRLGVSLSTAILLLCSSLFGSYFNIPLVWLPGQQIESGRVIAFFGMHYIVPVVVNWPGTIIAVNIGGALIPSVMAGYLLIKNRLWIKGALATAGVAFVCHWLATPVPGLGIAIPVFVPAVSTAIVAVLLSSRYAAQLAYIGGSLGTLIGADLLNLGSVAGLHAPIASIGGAGTFDGIFVTGIVAVLLASLPRIGKPPHASSGPRES
jgi:uncharacterized membrane protein